MKIILIVALLIQTGENLGVRCFEGKQHETLQLAAQGHVIWMAQNQIQGHQNWDSRKQAVMKVVKINCEEVCAESWPGQSKSEAAAEMFHSWKQSPGHWAAINKPCKIYGFAMARGQNGVWYGCGIVGR